MGSLPGNKVSADCSYYIDNQVTVTVPIWDVAGGTGQKADRSIIDPALRPIALSPAERADLLAFVNMINSVMARFPSKPQQAAPKMSIKSVLDWRQDRKSVV